jgi:hypothetical protein
MEYTIKQGDTLSKIATKFNLPVTAILASNPHIANPDLIAVGQVIHILNIEDLPESATFEVPGSPSSYVLRARSVVNCDIKYKLGSGGLNPNSQLPSNDKLCDCSGFVCWVFHLSRKTNIPFYKQYGGWIFTDSMVEDINSSTGIFERLTVPSVGCIVVYGAGKKIGHVGIVSEVQNNLMKKVIHCSSGNSSKFNAAIQETSPSVFNRPDSVWGRFIG